jgi:RND family efflux transporter MFP subunit
MKRILYFLVPVLLLGGLIGWRFNAKNKEKVERDKTAQARKSAPPSVQVAEATRRDIVHVFEGVGSAESPLTIQISPQVAGRIAYLELREGAAVRKGDLLARIDPTEIQAQVSQQQANVAEAESRLAQAAVTTGANTVSITSQIQQQQAATSSAAATLNQAEKTYAAQVAAAQAAVTDAQGKIDSATAGIANAEAGIQSTQAALNNAQTRYDRVYSLYKQGFIAAQDVDDARAQVKAQTSAVKVAQGQLNAAKAVRDSAVAQKKAAEQQAAIAVEKGKADIQAAQAARRQAQAALTSARANTAQTSAYRQNLAALRATVDAAKAQLRNVQVQLSRTTLTSPVNGFVTARLMEPGMVASVGQPILELQTVRQIYVTTSVPEDISRRIYQGLSAECTFDALPNRTFVGKVAQVNPAADTQSRQFVVRITLNNPQNEIKPGMFARVKMETERTRNAIVVPREAVKQGKDGATVTVIDAESVAHTRPVTTQDSDAQGIAIASGLEVGERVVRLSGAPVKDGVKVRVAEEEMREQETGDRGQNTANASTTQRPNDPLETQKSKIENPATGGVR